MVGLFGVGFVALWPAYARLVLLIGGRPRRLMVGLLEFRVCWAVFGGPGSVAVVVIASGWDGLAGLLIACSASSLCLVGIDDCLSCFMVGVLRFLRSIAPWAHGGMLGGASSGIRGKLLVAWPLSLVLNALRSLPTPLLGP